MCRCVCDAPPSPPFFPLIASVSSVSSVTSEDTDAEIERAILETIPTHTGRRNRQVFELARALKGIPRLADAPADAMKPYVRRWHRIGLERGVIATVPFEETLIDFLHAWPRVKFPKGNQRVLAIVQRAKDSPPPAVAQNYEGDGLRLLVSICREFQRESGSNPFFLSCRMAATLLGLGENGHVSAWRWLELLVHDKVLENVERWRTRQAAARPATATSETAKHDHDQGRQAGAVAERARRGPGIGPAHRSDGGRDKCARSCDC